MRYLDFQQIHFKVRNRPEDTTFEELLTALLFGGSTTKKALNASYDLAGLARTEKGLLYLDPERIASVSGIGQARANTMVAAIELARRMYINAWPKGKPVDLWDLARHLQVKLEGLGREYFYLFSFNRSFGLIQEHILSRGGTEAVNVYIRDIVKTLLNDRAAQALIAHNHPDQSAQPSEEDLLSMEKLEDLLNELGICLADQYIVGIDGVYSCKEAKILFPKNRVA